jgi:hypothetical protein
MQRKWREWLSSKYPDELTDRANARRMTGSATCGSHEDPGYRFAHPGYASLTPASRRQDHTTSPSASAALVRRSFGVHRIPHPTFVTTAKRPSYRARDGVNLNCVGACRKDATLRPNNTTGNSHGRRSAVAQ